MKTNWRFPLEKYALRTALSMGFGISIAFVLSCGHKAASKPEEPRNAIIEELVKVLMMACSLQFTEPQVVAVDNVPVDKSKATTYGGVTYTSTYTVTYSEDPLVSIILDDIKKELALAPDESITTTKFVVFAEVPYPTLVANPTAHEVVRRARSEVDNTNFDWKYQLSDCACPVAIQPSPLKLGLGDFNAEWFVVTNRRVVRFDIAYFEHPVAGKDHWTLKSNLLHDYSILAIDKPQDDYLR